MSFITCGWLPVFTSVCILSLAVLARGTADSAWPILDLILLPSVKLVSMAEILFASMPINTDAMPEIAISRALLVVKKSVKLFLNQQQ